MEQDGRTPATELEDHNFFFTERSDKAYQSDTYLLCGDGIGWGAQATKKPT